MIRDVKLTKSALKDVEKAPEHIQDAFTGWVAAVERDGVEAVRKLPGYHDEPLKGKRKGERSVRLSRQWRAIYIERGEAIQFLEVREVNPHEY